VIPFEQMVPAEQKMHLEETHGFIYNLLDDPAAAHAEDHEMFKYQHSHGH
jgi:hypothetical protein